MAGVAEIYMEAHNFKSFGGNKMSNPDQSKSNFKAKDKTNLSNSGSTSQNKTSNVKGKTDNTNIRCYNCQTLGHKADHCTKPKKTKTVASVGLRPTTTKCEGASHNYSYREQSRPAPHCWKCGCQESTGCNVQILQPCCINGKDKVTLNCGHELEVLQMTNCICQHKMPVVEMYMTGKKISVLRDTGCNTTLVRNSLTQTCVLIDGTIKTFPIANVSLSTPYFTGNTQCLVMDNPIYDVIIGNVKGARKADDPDSMKHPDPSTMEENPV